MRFKRRKKPSLFLHAYVYEHCLIYYVSWWCGPGFNLEPAAHKANTSLVGHWGHHICTVTLNTLQVNADKKGFQVT